MLTEPGLSVINEALKQARITFERMKSYSTFRITETIRIILFMTLTILVFDFYPITALMIILLAMLNDLPILAIDHFLNSPAKMGPYPSSIRQKDIRGFVSGEVSYGY